MEVTVAPDVGFCQQLLASLLPQHCPAETVLACLEDILSDYSECHTFNRVSIIVGCLKYLLDLDSEDLLIDAVEQVAAYYRSASVFFKSIFLERLRTANLFVIQTLFCSRFVTCDNSLPRHLLFNNTFTKSHILRVAKPYLMGLGENKYFNLGVAVDEFIEKPKYISFEEKEITKVSMSNNHTLFLTLQGDVYGCGSTSAGQLGYTSTNVVVTPIKIKIPIPQRARILDIIACEEYSAFITHSTVYACGSIVESELTSRGFCSLPVDCCQDDRLMEIFGGPSCILVCSHQELYGFGSINGKKYQHFTKVGAGLDLGFDFHPLLDVDKVKGSHAFRNFLSMPAGYRNCYNHISMQPFPQLYRKHNNRFLNIPYEDKHIKIECRIPYQDSYFFDSLENTIFAPLHIVLQNKEIKECYAVLDGIICPLRVWQFEANDSGDIIVLAQVYIENSSRAVYAQQSPCLYRGKIQMTKRECGEDFGFTVQSNLKGFDDIRELDYFLFLEEVPSSHGASFFASSPDCKNLIWKIESNPYFARDELESLRWKSTDISYLNEIRNHCGLEPFMPDIEIWQHCSNSEQRYETTMEILGSRISVLLPFVQNSVLDLNKALISLCGSDRLSGLILNYIKGGLFVTSRCFNPSEEILDSASGNIKVVSEQHHISRLGLCLAYQGINLYRVERANSESQHSIYNCILQTVDGVEMECNQDWIRLHSNYFEVAMHYKEDGLPVFKIDYEHILLTTAFGVLRNPDSLLVMPVDEIYKIMNFFDQYIFDAALEDCFQALFYRAGEFTLVHLFHLYLNMFHIREKLVKLFVDRLDLLCFWVSSSLAPIQLLKEVETAISTTSQLYRDSAKNPLFIDKYFSGISDSVCPNWAWYKMEYLKETLLGQNLSKIISRELEEAMRIARKSVQPPPLCSFFGFDKDINIDEITRVLRSLIEKQFLNSDRKKTPQRLRKKSTRLSETEKTQSQSKNSEITRQRSSRSERADSISGVSISSVDPIWTVSVDANPKVSSPVDVSSSVFSLAFPETISPLRATIPRKAKEKIRFHGKGKIANHLLGEENHTHLAPWASQVPLNIASLSLAEIQAEEERVNRNKPSTSKAQSAVKPVGPWSSNTSKIQRDSSHNLSLSEIMEQEEDKIKRSKIKFSRPLCLIETEEFAIEQLKQLYAESFGNEVIITIERVDPSQDQPVWVPYRS